MTRPYTDSIVSIIGTLQISASDKGVTSISLVSKPALDPLPNNHTNEAKKQLSHYFKGERKEFTLDIDLSGSTEFMYNVWQQVANIPYGKTKSYLEIAHAINNPKSVRAVGMANGKNPIPIVIPCHRVIGSNGDLTGYALGLEIKSKLLALENPKSFAPQGTLF